MNNLSDTRKALGLSKYRVAKHLGCSWAHYHLVERGERTLSQAKMALLQQLFNQTQTNK